MSKAEQAVEKAKEKAAENGIENPNGAFISAFAPLYLAAVPLANYLSKPDGFVGKAVDGIVDILAKLTGSNVPSGRVIPALSAVYVFWTFGATGAFSAAGQAMGRDDGLDNNCPRQHVHNLKGLPLRLRSAHYNLMENFSGFALAAALAQTVGAGDRTVVNLLGLHMLLKVFVYYPVYLADIPPPRTLSHVLATGSLIGVCWRLATGGR